jgi:outer membrane protein TolC
MAFSQNITMEQLFDMVDSQHPLIKEQELSPKIETRNKEKYLAEKDWFVNATQTYVHTNPVSTSPFSPERIDKIAFSSNLRKSLWISGGDLSFSVETSFTEQDFPSFDLGGQPGGGQQQTPSFSLPTGSDKMYQHQLNASYTQPLLQNFKGKLDRLDYELSDFDIQIAEIQSAENKEKFYLQLGNGFLDWVLLEEQRKIASERLDLAKKQLELVEEKRAVNLVDKVDLLRSEDAVRLAEQNLIFIQSQLKAKKAELAVLVQSNELTEKTPDFDIYTPVDLPAAEKAFQQTRKEIRMFKIIDENQQRLQKLSKSFSEIRRPQLDLTLGTGFQVGDEEIEDSFQMSEPDFSVTLAFSHPLGARSSEASIETTALQIRQLDFQKSKIALDLEAAITNIMIQIKEMENILALNKQQIESAKERTDEEERLYNQGRSQLTFVIQSRDNLQNAKLTYATNATNYHRMILQYRELTDQLAEKERN